jgi:hypothetical protein
MKAFNLFSSFSDSIGLTIVVLSLFFNFKKLQDTNKKWITLFYFFFWSTTVYATLIIFFNQTNTWLYNSIPFLLSTPLCFFFFSVHSSKILKIFNAIFIFSCILFAIIFWRQIIFKNFNPIFYLTFSFYILINSVGYLYEEMTTMRSNNLFKKTEFWFVSCLFFYATICVITWSLFSYLEDNIAAQNRFLHPGTLWMYGHNNILFIQSLVFSTAIFKTASKK